MIIIRAPVFAGAFYIGVVIEGVENTNRYDKNDTIFTNTKTITQ